VGEIGSFVGLLQILVEDFCWDFFRIFVWALELVLTFTESLDLVFLVVLVSLAVGPGTSAGAMMDFIALETMFAVLLRGVGVRSPLTIFLRAFLPLPLSEGFNFLGLAMDFFL
jgi:hypothetical protein